MWEESEIHPENINIFRQKFCWVFLKMFEEHDMFWQLKDHVINFNLVQFKLWVFYQLFVPQKQTNKTLNVKIFFS